MFKKLLLLLAISVSGFCGSEDSSQSFYMPFLSALKDAKGKNKESHSMAGIDFIYVVTAKKCHRFNDLKGRFLRYGINPYRFTAFQSKDISFDTMFRTCVHGSRRYKRIKSNKLSMHRGKPVLNKRKMSSAKAGYIHRNMSIKALSRTLSHLSIIRDAYVSGYETIWIMDSATELRCDPTILSTYISRANNEIPDWTSLYTDYSERDKGDNIEPLGHFFGRPDFEFLEPDDYLSREFNDEDIGADEDVYYEDDNSIGKISPKDTLGRLQAEEKLVCEEWDKKHGNEEGSGDGATGPSDQPGSNSSYVPKSRDRAAFTVQNKFSTISPSSSPADIEKFSHVGLLKGAHSYVLNRKGMKLILDWYTDHKIYIPYAQEIQIIPNMHPYCVPEPVTRNMNKG